MPRPEYVGKLLIRDTKALFMPCGVRVAAMRKMVTAFDGAEALQQCVWKYHDLPSQY